ncbi:predicted protein [Uncinocarpus reesii 1704]|uniref:C2 NT-type domain-containing protein n=1 Tax=Uncinocarpus reesii (strain UAMH 1704) TaxID=336963 RepID=C4JK80_UNCRE|nr:uncharacterized protein UREG_02037 [Uncinocarpus reesii 1704]EEP77188.1 predicted protein [Uncinocarpus reesii 1704]
MDPLGVVAFAASELTNIIDIINVPLGVGTAYVKWQLPSSASPEHAGETAKVQLQAHRATWGYEKGLTVRLMVDRNQMLQDCAIHFDIFQEFSPNNRSDRSLLGNIDLNLAEYVDEGDTEEGVVRRYLMQNSKINATVKIGIMMHQIEGESNFTAPPLKPATVFSGIAGFMNATKGESEDARRVPSFHQRTAEYTELRDLYFRNLAASWASRAGELPPDQVIEDIFAGGDGWASGRPSLKRDDDEDETGSLSDAESRRTVRSKSPARSTRSGDSLGNHLRSRSKHSDFSFSSDVGDKEHKGKGKRRKNREVSEFEVREDLRSWEISWAK